MSSFSSRVTCCCCCFFFWFLLCVSNNVVVAMNYKECNFPAIFNFGDSNSDTGAFSAAILPLPLPYGRTYFASPSGRLSDGRLIIDFIANKLSLPLLSAYLDSLGTNYMKGSNFAISGSTILLANKSSIPFTGLKPFYLDIEYRQFANFMSKSQILRNQGKSPNTLPKAEYFPEALYTIDIGQNDIGGALLSGSSVDDVRTMIPSFVNGLSLHITSLYGIGARSFWIHNTGPIGCLAYILSEIPTPPEEIDGAGCAIPYNDLAQFYNTKLKESVYLLRQTLPLAAITYVDIYSIKYSFFSQPQVHGFFEPLKVCCGFGGAYNYDSNIPCGLAPSCIDPSIKVNWDGIHYTEAANKIVFEFISTGNFSDPQLPASLACQRFA